MEFSVEIVRFGATGCGSIHGPLDRHYCDIGLLQSSPSTALGAYVAELINIVAKYYL